MTDREKAIDHLQIMHTWATFALEKDKNFFTEKHMEHIAEWTEDAIVSMEEQKQMYLALEKDWKMLRAEYTEQQRPVEPEMEGGGSSWWMVCGECHGQIDEKDDYCRHCGRRILRNEKRK